MLLICQEGQIKPLSPMALIFKGESMQALNSTLSLVFLIHFEMKKFK